MDKYADDRNDTKRVKEASHQMTKAWIKGIEKVKSPFSDK